MAKRSSTVYLEEKFWTMVDNYQKECDMSSRNDAFQMILHEWSILRKIDFNNIKVNVNIGSIEGKIETSASIGDNSNKETVFIENEEKEKEKIDPRITNGILKIASSMKTEG